MGLITPDTSGIVDGQVIDAADVTSPISTITNEINGLLDTNNFLANGTNLATIAQAVAWSTWVPTFTGFSADPAGGIYTYMQIGKSVWINVRMPNNGTSNATTFTVSLPVTAKATTNQLFGTTIAVSVDNSAQTTTKDQAYIDYATPTVVTLSKNINDSGWTASGGKRASFQLFYEAA